MKKSNVSLELHKGMSKIIITKSHNMIIIKQQKQNRTKHGRLQISQCANTEFCNSLPNEEEKLVPVVFILLDCQYLHNQTYFKHHIS